jgi:hypothetical protein
MATKIGYVRRDPTEQINWAEVGSNFSGILKEEARVREEKKAEIDRSTREMQKVLQESPMGDSDNMNTWALSYAAEAQSQLLMTNALLKNGQLKPQDYTVIRQNLADGTDQAFTLAQEYQSEYADKMARMKAEFGGIGPDGNPITPSQKLEQYLMETAEGFGNFNKSKLVINPTTGNVMVGFINDKGEVESDPNKLVGINNLRNRIKGKFDKYDMRANITKAKAETFGKFSFVKAQLGTLHQKGLLETYKGAALRGKNAVDALISKGIITKEEAELMGSFEKTQDAWAESQLSNDYNTTSLLTNNLGGFAPNGKQYNFTFNPAEENENTILLKQVDGNVVPNFDSKVGKAHREAAKEGLLTNLRGALDLEIDAQAISGTQYQQPTPQRYDPNADDASKIRKLQSTAMLNSSYLYSGTEAQFAEAESFFKSMNSNIEAISRDNNGVTIYFKGGVIENAPFFGGGGVLNERQWVTGNTNYLLTDNYKILDVNKTFQRSGSAGEAKMPSVGKVTTSRVTETNEPVSTTFDRELKNRGFVSSVFVKNGEDKTVDNLRGILSSIPSTVGWTVSGDGSWDLSSDGVIIKDGTGNEIARFELDGNDMAEEGVADSYATKLRQIIFANSSEVQKALINEGKSKKLRTSFGSGKSGTF